MAFVQTEAFYYIKMSVFSIKNDGNYLFDLQTFFYHNFRNSGNARASNV